MFVLLRRKIKRIDWGESGAARAVPLSAIWAAADRGQIPWTQYAADQSGA